jgi:hypothetical protein
MLKAVYYKNATDKEHQGHEEDIVKVDEEIQAQPSGGVYNWMGRGDISVFIEPCKGGVGKGGVMGYH